MTIKTTPFFLTLILLLTSFAAQAKTVRYDLKISSFKANITGRPVDFALAVNGSIPAPTLEFTEGDDAEIKVTNDLKDEEVSLHWHGILLPPEEDGVAYVNTPPIFPGASRTFKFRLRQNGTYWYHSHTMLQEQKGVYGAIVIHPKKPSALRADAEAVAVLSDWSDEDADQILKNLKKDGDYYLWKKGTIRSIYGATRAGKLGTYFNNEWQRMGGMDLSDVGYDAFLINGKRDSQLTAKSGGKVRVRIINAGSSSYFYVSFGGAPVTVIAADGLDIEPREAKEILMGMAETYDVLVDVPKGKNIEMLAYSQDGTGEATAWLGEASGEKIKAPRRAAHDLYAAMDHSSHSGHGGHDAHASHGAANANDATHETMDPSEHAEHSDHADHSEHADHEIEKPRVLDTLTVDNLRALKATTLPLDSTKGAKVHNVKLVLGGDMARYVWHINGKAIFEDRYLDVKENDVVRITFENSTMMHHPLHLHGHFFRVITAAADFSPLKHTVDVGPMGNRTIEFLANEPGRWMLHCHNLFHMHSGMARIVNYISFQPSHELQHLEHQDHHLHDPWFMKSALGLTTNLAEARFRVSQTWNEFELRAESRRDDNWTAEGDLFYRRWQGNYLNYIAGGSIVHHETRAQVGLGYMLPMLIRTNLLIDQKAKFRVDLEKHFQWTSHVFTDVEYRWRQDTELGNEITASLMYAPNWSWSAGFKLTEHSVGVGAYYQF